MKKSNHKILRFYVILATGLAISLVIAACMNTSQTGIPANLQNWKQLSVQVDSAKKMLGQLNDAHTKLVAEHGERMGDSNDSTHLRIEKMHQETIERFSQAIAAHQMNLLSLGELMSVKKATEAGQEDTDRKSILQESLSLRKDMQDMQQHIISFRREHDEMLSSHR